MRKGEKLFENVGKLLYKKYGNMVFPENIYYYIQNEMNDEEFDKVIKEEEKNESV